MTSRGPEEPLPETALGDTEPHPEEVARSILLRQLTASPKSRKQLADKLAEKNVPEDVANTVLDRFEDVNLINDEEFAFMWVRSRQQGKGLARGALRRELKSKGIDGEEAEQALEAVTDDDEWEAARTLVEKKLRNQRVPTGSDPEARGERDKVVRRLVSMLARKGYSPGLGFDVVKELMAVRIENDEDLE
ncbi:MAG: regulatory protein RecX [Micrococcaceae bacterium]